LLCSYSNYVENLILIIAKNLNSNRLRELKAKNTYFMSRKIKLIWDFRGPAAQKTAEHHVIHLKEFIAIEKTNLNITGCQDFNDLYSIAFMVVDEVEMIAVRDALKPHRGEVYSEPAES